MTESRTSSVADRSGAGGDKQRIGGVDESRQGRRRPGAVAVAGRARRFSVFAVIAALAAVTFGLSSAQAHTTTATLFPNGQGTYTAWTNGEDQIDETGTPDCGSGESVIESTGNDRESVLISLATRPRRCDDHVRRRPGVAPRRQRRRRNVPDLREAQRHRHRLGHEHRRGWQFGRLLGPGHADHQRGRHRQGGRHGARSRRPQDRRQRSDRSRRSDPRDRDLQPRPVRADALLARRRRLDRRSNSDVRLERGQRRPRRPDCDRHPVAQRTGVLYGMDR